MVLIVTPCVVIYHNQSSSNAPQILGIGRTRLDAGIHQTLCDACEVWVMR